MHYPKEDDGEHYTACLLIKGLRGIEPRILYPKEESGSHCLLILDLKPHSAGLKNGSTIDEYIYKWCRSVKDIDVSDWTQIYGLDIIKSREFFLANEDANFENVEFYYLQVFKGDVIVAIVPCFCYRMDILNIASSPAARKWLVWIRKFYPSFLKMRAFVTGSYAASCEHFICYASSLDTKSKEEVSSIISGEIKKYSGKTKSSFVFIKDVRERDLQYVKDILTSDYHFFVSFPTTAIPVLSDLEYPDALRKKNRKRYRKYKNLFDTSFEWNIINNVSGENAGHCQTSVDEFFRFSQKCVTGGT